MTIDVQYEQETLCRIPERHLPTFRILCESAGIASTYSPSKRTLLLRKWLEDRHILLIREPGIAGAEPLAGFCDQLMAHLEEVDAKVDLAFSRPPARAPQYDLVLYITAGAGSTLRCTHAHRNTYARHLADRIVAQFAQHSGSNAVLIADRWSPFRLRSRARLALPDGVPAVYLEVPLYEGPQSEATYTRMALAVYQGILDYFGARAPLLAHIEPEVWEPFLRHVIPRVFPRHSDNAVTPQRDEAVPHPATAPVEQAIHAATDAAPTPPVNPITPPATGEPTGPATEAAEAEAETDRKPVEQDTPPVAPAETETAEEETAEEKEEETADQTQPPLTAETLLVRANASRAPAEDTSHFYPAVIQQGLRRIQPTLSPDDVQQAAAATPLPAPGRPPQVPGVQVTVFPRPLRRRVGEVLHQPAPTPVPAEPPMPEPASPPAAAGGCQTCGKVTWKPRRTHA